MSERSFGSRGESRSRIDRRSVLRGIVASGLAGAVGGQASARGGDGASRNGDASLAGRGEQAGDVAVRWAGEAEQCVGIEPLRNEEQTITEFYGYTPDESEPNPRQSNTGLERPGVSRLFIYQGPEGLSLVIIHGGGEGEEGGAASFEISGLPPDGEWAVLDDGYEGSGDIFEIGETTSTFHWTWGVLGRNDGGAFRGLGENFQVRIEPAFNEAARRDPLGDGSVTDWEVLSGSIDDPEAISVPMDQPLVVGTVDQPDECPPLDTDDEEDAEGEIDARIADLSVPGGTYEPGDVVPAHVTVENTGGRDHRFIVGYSAIDPDGVGHHNDGTTDEAVDVPQGETVEKTVTWTVEPDVPAGTYGVRVIVWRRRTDDGLHGNLDKREIESVFEVSGTE